MLDIIAEVESIGSNMWDSVWTQYAARATANKFPVLDAAMINQNLDRLSHENKSTGNPTSPPAVRKEKVVLQAILGRAEADSLGVNPESEVEVDDAAELRGRLIIRDCVLANVKGSVHLDLVV